MSFRGLSGQSAIEYLMTYGWMLLVVAVVGGAIFATVGDQGVESTSGFDGDVQVDDFGVSDQDELGLEVRDGSGQGITVSKVNVSDPDTGQWIYKEFTGENSIGVGSSKVFELPNVTRSDSANELDVEVIYDSEGLSNLSEEGTVNGQLELNNTGSFEGLPEDDHQSVDEEVPQTYQIDNFEETSRRENYDFVSRDSFTENITIDYQNSYVQEGSMAGNLTINISEGKYGATESALISTSGLENYPQSGDTFQTSFSPNHTSGLGDVAIGMAFGMNSTGPGYTLVVYQSDLLQLRRYDGKDMVVDEYLQTEKFSKLDLDDWYRLRVNWKEDNNITGYLMNQTGEKIAKVSAIDSTYSDQKGFGWHMRGYSVLDSGYEQHSFIVDDSKIVKD